MNQLTMTRDGPAFSNPVMALPSPTTRHQGQGETSTMDHSLAGLPGFLVVSLEESFFTKVVDHSSHSCPCKLPRNISERSAARWLAPERAGLGPSAPPTIPSMIWLKLLDEGPFLHLISGFSMATCHAFLDRFTPLRATDSLSPLHCNFKWRPESLAIHTFRIDICADQFCLAKN